MIMVGFLAGIAFVYSCGGGGSSSSADAAAEGVLLTEAVS
jgi:hypothetical protein